MKEFVYFTAGIILVAVAVSGLYLYMNPSDDLLYCERNKPEFNNSPENSERDNRCYNELWPEYCEIRSPRHCPGNYEVIAELAENVSILFNVSITYNDTKGVNLSKEVNLSSLLPS